MEWWEDPNWEDPERKAIRDEQRRQARLEHWWERQEDGRPRLDWVDLAEGVLDLLLALIDAIT